MKWTDGSYYMGMWEKGIQQGLGIMIFSDGAKRAGKFEQNIFKETIKTKTELNSVRNKLSEECVREIEAYIEKRAKLGKNNSEDVI